jgi:pseudaminic acid synthase
MKPLKINKKLIDQDHPVYIIAELSANHKGDFNLAKESLQAIKETGADAVKLQTFTPDSMTLNLDKSEFLTRKDSLWAGMKLYDLYKESSVPYDWHSKLKEIADNLDLDFFSTPFDKEGVNLLMEIDVPAFKIASLEITDIPLIEYVASKGKPIILSTGIASLDDIDLAVETCKKAGNNQIAILKCTSAYPTPASEANLLGISVLKERYKKITGLSDHTLGYLAPVAAIALDAKIIEKHFILDKKIKSLDAVFSLDKDEFTEMVKMVRQTEAMMGSNEYEVTDVMQRARKSARSLIATQNIQIGELFTENNVKSLRPGIGLHPKYYQKILGHQARRNFECGTPLDESDLP